MFRSAILVMEHNFSLKVEIVDKLQIKTCFFRRKENSNNIRLQLFLLVINLLICFSTNQFVSVTSDVL